MQPVIGGDAGDGSCRRSAIGRRPFWFHVDHAGRSSALFAAERPWSSSCSDCTVSMFSRASNAHVTGSGMLEPVTASSWFGRSSPPRRARARVSCTTPLKHWEGVAGRAARGEGRELPPPCSVALGGLVQVDPGAEHHVHSTDRRIRDVTHVTVSWLPSPSFKAAAPPRKRKHPSRSPPSGTAGALQLRPLNCRTCRPAISPGRNPPAVHPGPLDGHAVFFHDAAVHRYLCPHGQGGERAN